ncbi:MAG: hypothetical protein IT366_12825 [Candidatus Hydrogenedentes bacterium]|nr:hypothetical protein [Candidatus Hydrogenedentota bacterium]
MTWVTTILEPSPDGTLHIPVPEELRGYRLSVQASLHPVDAAGKLCATPEMVARRMEALEALRALGGLSDVIPDPVAWQREMREDRPLPGRD